MWVMGFPYHPFCIIMKVRMLKQIKLEGNMKQLYRELAEQMSSFMKPDQILLAESMKNHTSFRVGGPCDLMVKPSSIEELEKVLKLADALEIPKLIIGKGSNILVRDQGIRGLVVKLDEAFSRLSVSGNLLSAQSGISLRKLAERARDHSLSGLEFAHGIPGSLGGAITMNAGAYGGEMKDVVKSVTLMSPDYKVFELSNREMEFCYRTSVVQKEQYIVLGAEFALASGDEAEISAKMKDYMQRRMDKQPLNYPSAGSVFKRPEGYFAGVLIEECGLKGLRYGGAMVSDKHAGFIVNAGDATASDVLHLIQIIQKTVYDTKKVKLEREVKLL